MSLTPEQEKQWNKDLKLTIELHQKIEEFGNMFQYCLPQNIEIHERVQLCTDMLVKIKELIFMTDSREVFLLCSLGVLINELESLIGDQTLKLNQEIK